MKKAQKLPFYFFWDKQSIIWSIGILFLIAGVVMFAFLPEIIRSNKLARLNGQAMGQIIYIKENTTMRQGREGNRIIVDSYEVRYQYRVYGRVHTGRNVINSNAKNSKYLRKIERSNYQQPVIVRYDPEKPYNSLIKLE